MDEEARYLEALNEKARAIVEMSIRNAIEYLREEQLREKMAMGDLQAYPQKEEYVIKNIQWSTCEDFTVTNGLQQIEDYISTWELHESWLHCTDFVRQENLEFCRRYHYRMMWSIPTRRTPIPRAVARVYFIIDISKIKPTTFPVEVFFLLESNRLQHRPGQTRFREKWLKDIIESKINLMEDIFF